MLGPGQKGFCRLELWDFKGGRDASSEGLTACILEAVEVALAAIANNGEAPIPSWKYKVDYWALPLEFLVKDCTTRLGHFENIK